MGYTLLYIAFGIVALWLLGEVFLQHKARLRWRVVAFVGFLFVVVGVILPQVVVIILGAVGFGTGQTFVTLSHRRGFVTGWALGGKPGSSRRRRDANRAARTEPDPESESGFEPDEAARPPEAAESGYEAVEAMAPDADETPLYSPSPLPEDDPDYGVYADGSYPSAGYDEYAAAPGYGSDWQAEPQPAAAYAYDSYGGTADDDVFAKGADSLRPEADPSYAAYDQSAYQQQGYQSYDPYAAASPGYESYDGYGQYPPQQDYAGYQQPQYPQETYQQQGYGYPSQPAADGWSGADPYGGQQPHIPQQATPGYEQEQPAEGYENYQQYESYQPYGY